MDPDLHYECGSRSRRNPDERFFTFEQSFFNQLIFDISFTVLYSENGNRNPIVGTGTNRGQFQQTLYRYRVIFFNSLKSHRAVLNS